MSATVAGTGNLTDLSFSGSPHRVVSLVPSITGSLFDLQLGHCLAGVTDFCVYPAAGVAGLPKVGGTKNPDIQRILALRPDRVIASQEENRREDVAALAKYPNLWIKLSDLPVEADLEHWSEAELRPYIAATLETFGPERTIYAGDYPILLQSTNLTEWVDVLDDAFADLGLTEAETRKIYRDNAIQFYRLDV